jgi:uncharacterized protein with beta-barrel porin domain
MRARSSKLLSGVSLMAVVAAFASAGHASAAAFTGPFWTDPIINADPASTTITANAKVLHDANNDSFYNGIGMVDLTVDASYLSGAIHNAAAGTITTGVGIVIQNFSQIDGGIWNEGTIDGTTSGITIDTGSAVEVQFLNDGSISGAVNGVLLGANSAINGGVTNNGDITGATGFNMSGATSEIRGGIANTSGASIVGTTAAAISASGAGLLLQGGITNDGLIQGQNTAEGISLTNGTITGGITNNATGIVEVTGATNTAILVNGATFNGSITNSGQVLGDSAGSFGIVITGTTAFTGNIVNNSGGLISADQTAVAANSASFVGDITNNGTINAAVLDGVHAAGAAFTGNILNSSTGAITAGSDGIEVSATAFTGNVTNDGTITAGVSGIYVNSAAFLGNVTNNGAITSLTSSGIGVGDLGVITGTITNSATGVVTGNAAGIWIDGSVSGGISNAGTITGETYGIDLGTANAGHTITQTAGLIQGNNAGTVTTALNLVNTQADTFNGDGGTLDGDVAGDVGGADNFVMHATGTFSYLRGTATDLNQFDMLGTGTAVLGADLRGSTGAGVTVNAASMTHSGTGTVYLDDDTILNVGAYTQSAGILEFQLTSDTTPGAYGQIVAGAANLGGNIAAYIQGDTFASVGGNTFSYQDVILGPTAGTFANAGAITTNSIFFTGIAQVNAGDVDIVLTRQGFSTALALANLSQNQQTIGATLETIYNAGGYSPDFVDLFNYLLSIPAGSEAEVARVYDDLSGSEHASVQDAGLRISQGFNDAVGARLDDLRGPAGAAATAELALRRYADATPTDTATDAMARPGGMRGSMSIWGRGYGAWTQSDGDAEAAGYNQDTGGFAGGMDFAVDSRWNVGGAIGYSTSDVEFDTLRDSADIDAFQFAGYGAYTGKSFYADAQIGFGFLDITSTRLIDVTLNPPVVASASYDANAFGVRTEVGIIYDTGRIDFTPFLGLAYASTSTDGFVESGAGAFDLLVAESDADSLATTLGLRLSGAWQAGGVRLVPVAEIAWRHEFLDDDQSFSASFLEDPATQFQIVSAEQARDTIIANLGLGAQVSKSLVVFLDYNGQFSSSLNTHAASAGLRATW